MTRLATRRELLSGGAGLVAALAGCRGSGERWMESPTPVSSDDWPAVQWRHQTTAPPEEMLTDPSGAPVYLFMDGWAAAYAADGHRRWQPKQVGRARTTTDDGFLAVDDGALAAFDGTTGERRWSVSVGANADFPVAMFLDGDAYAVGARIDSGSTRVHDEFARLYRIDGSAADAQQIADLPGEPVDDWVGTAAGEALFLARDDGLVVAYDTDGTERWRTDLRSGEETPSTATVTVTEEEFEPDRTPDRSTGEGLAIRFGGVTDGTLFVGVAGGLKSVHALSTDDGTVRWETTGYDAVESVAGETAVLFGGSEQVGFRFAGVDPATGAERWTRTIDRTGYYRGPGVGSDGVFYAPFALYDGGLSVPALDAATGETIDEFSREEGIFVGVGLLGNSLVVLTRTERGGEIWATALLDSAD